jgi:hypothetical protein
MRIRKNGKSTGNVLFRTGTVYEFKQCSLCRTVPEIIDPVFVKTSQNARILLSENERFGLVFVKTGSLNSGTEQINK